MGYPASIIPEKIFFKIGEVCDLVGVQAHVLRYWETEFPMLAPQKNRSGQRTYRRRDVEMAMRVKELLYDDLYTIAGAKKRLAGEMRESTKLKIVHPEPKAEMPESKSSFITRKAPGQAPLFDEAMESSEAYDEGKIHQSGEIAHFEDRSDALKQIAAQLLELRQSISKSNKEDEKFRLRKY